MKKVYSINGDVAPKKFSEFKKWFKAASNLPISAEEAWELLGRKVPKDDSKRIKEKE